MFYVKREKNIRLRECGCRQLSFTENVSSLLFKPLIIFIKSSILDVWQGSEYASRITLYHQIHQTLREKCPYSELFWSVFSRIWTEYGDIQSISPHSVRMRENTD